MGIFRSYIYPRLIKTNRKKRKEKKKDRNDFIFNIAHESQGKNGTKLIDSNRFSGLCCESSITIENEALSERGIRVTGSLDFSLKKSKLLSVSGLTDLIERQAASHAFVSAALNPWPLKTSPSFSAPSRLSRSLPPPDKKFAP